MIDLNTLHYVLETTGARWQAVGFGERPEPGGMGLGYSPEAIEPSLPEREIRAFVNLQNFLSTAVVKEPSFAAVPGAAPAGPPDRFDWRDVNGSNYVTPPKAQGRCGSCVAFATAGALESAVRIARQTPTLAIDLSEAHLFFCYAAAQGRNCGNGWYMTAAMQASQKGVVDEACFRYVDADQKCDLCPDSEQRLTKITGYTILHAPIDFKNWLASRGPLVTGFTVYDDFQSYNSGIYSHVAGAALGGHAVLCVGYDDYQRCWICKNSWYETQWGEGGFFRIAYGQCGIDATMWGINGVA